MCTNAARLPGLKLKIEIRRIDVDRWSVTSPRPFEDIVSALGAAIGHLDIRTLLPKAEAEPSDGIETTIERALEQPGFVEFVRFDLSRIVAKELDASRRIRRLLTGNRLTGR